MRFQLSMFLRGYGLKTFEFRFSLSTPYSTITSTVLKVIKFGNSSAVVVPENKNSKTSCEYGYLLASAFD
jgi:hypothetical protein